MQHPTQPIHLPMPAPLRPHFTLRPARITVTAASATAAPTQLIIRVLARLLRPRAVTTHSGPDCNRTTHQVQLITIAKTHLNSRRQH
jgi:hypothetical protein